MSALTFIHKNGTITNLQDDNVITKIINGISSSPPRNVYAVKVARRDGDTPIGSDYGNRPISFEGNIKHDTATLLRTKLDTLKRDVSGKGVLVVEIDGSTIRRYNVEVMNWVTPEEAYNLTWLPYTLTFEAMDSPFGEDEDSTSLYSVDNTSSNISQSNVIDGSAEPAIDLQLFVNTPGTLTGIELQNISTNTSTEITRTFDPNDVVQIKSAENFVGLNGLPAKFDGNIMRFDTGANDWRINFKTSDSFLVVTEQKQQNSERYVFGTIRLAQSFVLASTSIITQIDVMLAKLGAPPNAAVAIQADSSSAPSGTDLVSAIVTNPVTESASFVPVPLGSPTELAAGTYWIVLTVGDNTTTGGGDINNGYYWKGSTQNPLASANASKRTSASTSWVAEANYDYAFRIFEGQTADTYADTSESTITEAFSSETYEDAANTNASWDGLGTLSFLGPDYRDLNWGQSLSYLTTNRLIAAEVKVSAVDYPKSGSCSYTMRPNATAAFVSLTKDVWRSFTGPELANVIDGAMQFKAYLTSGSANMDNWPYIDSITMAYKAAAITQGTDHLAQAFTLGASGYSLGSIDLMLKKLGTVTGSIAVEIQTDNAGSPSGTAVTNGTTTIDASSIPTSFSWVSATFSTAPALSASTKYWIVLKPAGSFGSDNFLLWRAKGNTSYTGGQYKYKIGAGSWSDTNSTDYDLLFRTTKGTGTSFSVSVDATYKKRWK